MRDKAMITNSFFVPYILQRKAQQRVTIRTNTKVVICAYAALIILYLSLVWLLPPNRSSLDKYNISVLQAKLLGLTFVLPLIGVWVSALYGYIRFRAYAILIRESPEGKPFNRLADGLMVLAFGLPIMAIMSSIFNYYTSSHPEWLPASTVIRNYADIIIYFFAFLLLFYGARGLHNSLRSRNLYQPAYFRHIGLIGIAVSAVFVWLLLANPLNPGSVTSQTIYYLPNWLIIFTVAIPYLISWYCGAMASYWLLAYKNRINAKVYKQPFSDLSKGIAVIVFDAMFIRFMTSVSPRLERLNLTPLLLIIYILVLLYILGYGLVARGAKGLKKIEEV